MAEENKEQQSELEQGEEPVQEPAEEPQDKPDKKKNSGGGLLMPILYALLAAVGAFTLVMIIGIVFTIVTRPAQPSELPSSEPSTGIIETQPPQTPDSEASDPGAVS